MVPLPYSQYKVRTLQDLVSLKDSDRRNMLRFLGEEKYDEVMAVLGSFPYINMETKLQGGFKQRLYSLTFNKKNNVSFKCFNSVSSSTVLDDEDSNNITAGSIVTVTVTLTRKRMFVSSTFSRISHGPPLLIQMFTWIGIATQLYYLIYVLGAVCVMHVDYDTLEFHQGSTRGQCWACFFFFFGWEFSSARLSYLFSKHYAWIACTARLY